jgi:hypothetical protein
MRCVKAHRCDLHQTFGIRLKGIMLPFNAVQRVGSTAYEYR